MTTNPNFPNKCMPIIFVCGDKGGVGKSFIARIIASLAIEKCIYTRGIDCDMRNAHLYRYFSQDINIERIAVRSEEGWNTLYHLFECSDKSHMIVVDLPGNIGDMIECEKDRLSLISSELRRPIILIWAAAEEEDSVAIFKRLSFIAPPNNSFFVMNGRFARSEVDFEIWKKSKTRQHFIESGGRELFLPVLPIRTRTSIANARCGFHKFPSVAPSVVEKIDFDIWWRNINKIFAPVLKLIGEFQ